MPGIASAATSVVIAHVAAATSRIRIGAGGIMLPNHAPLAIAEQFGTLAALHPGRIDLGLGRAPGSDMATARALRRDPASGDELVVGPYQGTLGCLRIPFGRGVCGAAAAERRTQIVEDVHAFPGHIACDSRSASEIVVPVLDVSGDLIAVLDVDATEKAAFDAVDAEWLERLTTKVFG